jgi:hypothetical protein
MVDTAKSSATTPPDSGTRLTLGHSIFARYAASPGVIHAPASIGLGREIALFGLNRLPLLESLQTRQGKADLSGVWRAAHFEWAQDGRFRRGSLPSPKAAMATVARLVATGSANSAVATPMPSKAEHVHSDISQGFEDPGRVVESSMPDPGSDRSSADRPEPDVSASLSSNIHLSVGEPPHVHKAIDRVRSPDSAGSRIDASTESDGHASSADSPLIEREFNSSPISNGPGAPRAQDAAAVTPHQTASARSSVTLRSELIHPANQMGVLRSPAIEEAPNSSTENPPSGQNREVGTSGIVHVEVASNPAVPAPSSLNPKSQTARQASRKSEPEATSNSDELGSAGRTSTSVNPPNVSREFLSSIPDASVQTVRETSVQSTAMREASVDSLRAASSSAPSYPRQFQRPIILRNAKDAQRATAMMSAEVSASLSSSTSSSLPVPSGMEKLTHFENLSSHRAAHAGVAGDRLSAGAGMQPSANSIEPSISRVHHFLPARPSMVHASTELERHPSEGSGVMISRASGSSALSPTSSLVSSFSPASVPAASGSGVPPDPPVLGSVVTPSIEEHAAAPLVHRTHSDMGEAGSIALSAVVPFAERAVAASQDNSETLAARLKAPEPILNMATAEFNATRYEQSWPGAQGAFTPVAGESPTKGGPGTGSSLTHRQGTHSLLRSGMAMRDAVVSQLPTSRDSSPRSAQAESMRVSIDGTSSASTASPNVPVVARVPDANRGVRVPGIIDRSIATAQPRASSHDPSFSTFAGVGLQEFSGSSLRSQPDRLDLTHLSAQRVSTSAAGVSTFQSALAKPAAIHRTMAPGPTSPISIPQPIPSSPQESQHAATQGSASLKNQDLNLLVNRVYELLVKRLASERRRGV